MPIRSKAITVQPELTARFWAKVRKTKTCWLWTGGTSDGYGMFWYQGSTIAAHRLAYAALVGRIPPDTELDHSCDRRACVRPDHLHVAAHRGNVLRGRNFTAVNARKFCCPKGHPYTVKKTKKRTQRFCRICATAVAAKKRRAQRFAKWNARWT